MQPELAYNNPTTIQTALNEITKLFLEDLTEWLNSLPNTTQKAQYLGHTFDTSTNKPDADPGIIQITLKAEKNYYTVPPTNNIHIAHFSIPQQLKSQGFYRIIWQTMSQNTPLVFDTISLPTSSNLRFYKDFLNESDNRDFFTYKRQSSNVAKVYTHAHYTPREQGGAPQSCIDNNTNTNT